MHACRSRHLSRLDRQRGLDQRGHCRATGGVSQLARDRTDHCRLVAVACLGLHEASRESLIFRGLAGPIGFPHCNIAGLHVGSRARPRDRQTQGVTPMIVMRRGHSSNDGVNAVTISLCIAKPFKNHDADTFAGHNAREAPIEQRAGMAGGVEHTIGSEHLVGRDPHGSLTGTTDHHVRVTR